MRRGRLAASPELGARFEMEQGVADAVAALRHLATLPELDGRAGVIGFCLGGSIAYFVAAQEDPAATVSFYGSAVLGNLDALDRIRGPLQFHFGGSDPYIPRDQVRRVEAAVAGRPNAEIHVAEEAGHAFHNWMASMFYQPQPAKKAWQRTEEFLRRHLPAPQ